MEGNIRVRDMLLIGYVKILRQMKTVMVLHLLTSYHAPDSVLIASHALSHVILKMTPG